ncbi:hypothetical protein BG015_009731 [Linnemannia schmuckeri]|uniref:Uncharacterized protein n=1 Tax=Linnemannia schmuckeri TaxID=64567 RepID=A0A9P5RXU1_9FUNG|nr:hypothetical protein BG015_009731 [Linnemannia schmuckeri]
MTAPPESMLVSQESPEKHGSSTSFKSIVPEPTSLLNDFNEVKTKIVIVMAGCKEGMEMLARNRLVSGQHAVQILCLEAYGRGSDKSPHAQKISLRPNSTPI